MVTLLCSIQCFHNRHRNIVQGDSVPDPVEGTYAYLPYADSNYADLAIITGGQSYQCGC